MIKHELIACIGNCIDNVYNYTSEFSDRKTIATLTDGLMNIRYTTIIRAGKDGDLQFHMRSIEDESKQMIKSRLKTIKSEFKNTSGLTLKTKKVSESNNVETLTVSPYSPIRTLKVNFSYSYEISC